MVTEKANLNYVSETGGKVLFSTLKSQMCRPPLPYFPLLYIRGHTTSCTDTEHLAWDVSLIKVSNFQTPKQRN